MATILKEPFLLNMLSVYILGRANDSILVKLPQSNKFLIIDDVHAPVSWVYLSLTTKLSGTPAVANDTVVPDSINAFCEYDI